MEEMKEYEIPEGYEARIEGNKVVLEPKESENKRITRAINNMLPFIPDEAYVSNGVTKEGVLNWLENQKEYMNDLSPEQEAYLLSERFKQAEKEKDEFVSCHFLQCLASFSVFRKGEHYWLEYVGGDMYVGRSDNVLGGKFHLTPRQLFNLFSDKPEGVQCPSQEEKQLSPIESLGISQEEYNKIVDECIWGEQKEQEPIKVYDNMDDLIVDAIIDEISKSNMSDSDKYNRIYWINKHRQKPAEWGEEDKENAAYIGAALEAYYKLRKEQNNTSGQTELDKAKEWLYNRFKFLRPQPHWKPSEEQMETLEYYMHVLICNKHKEILFGLYEQLKSL